MPHETTNYSGTKIWIYAWGMPKSSQRARQHKRDRAERTRLDAPETQLYVHDKTRCACRVVDIPVELTLDKTVRQVLHYDDRNKLVWFAVLYVRMEDARGTELYSVDTGHGHFHEHLHGHRKRDDRRNISPLYSQVHVQECFDTGYDTVLNKHLSMSGR